MVRTARRLADLFGGRDRRRWWLLVLVVLLTTVVEAASAGLVFVLVDLLATGSASAPLLGPMSVSGDLGPLAAVVVGLFIARAVLALTQSWLANGSCYAAGADLEQRLMLAYLSLSPRERRRRGSPELVRNVHDTVMLVVEGALIPIVMSAGLVLRVVGVGGVMVWVAPVPSALAVTVFAPSLWLLTRCLRSPTRRLGERVEQSLGRSLGLAGETLELAAELRMAGRTLEFSRRFGAVRHDLARAAAVDEVLGGVPRIAAETLLVLFVVAHVAVSVRQGDAATALPTLGLFAYSALRLLPSVVSILGLVQSVRMTAPALEALSGELPLLASVAARASRATRAPSPVVVELRGVTVQHAGASAVALDAIDLVLRRGDVIALVGPSGSGKSTLVDVLTGQLTPSSGQVLWDGSPLRPDDESWLLQVGLVSQHVRLLDADLVTNVTFGLDDDDRDEVGARAALGLVGAAHLDAALPRGPGSTLGEDGRSLSGGERQRVSLARALHRDAGLLVVDEGTAALDARARTDVLAALTAGRAGRITVLVTHDPVVAASCSRVLRMEGGRLVEQGHPEHVPSATSRNPTCSPDGATTLPAKQT